MPRLKNKPIATRLSEEDFNELERITKKYNCTKANVFEYGIHNYKFDTDKLTFIEIEANKEALDYLIKFRKESIINQYNEKFKKHLLENFENFNVRDIQKIKIFIGAIHTITNNDYSITFDLTTGLFEIFYYDSDNCYNLLSELDNKYNFIDTIKFVNDFYVSDRCKILFIKNDVDIIELD